MLVAWLENAELLDNRTLTRLSARLPAPQRDRLLRYRRWQDRQAGLFGKVLLGWMVDRLLVEETGLDALETDHFQRPFLSGVANFDFNISHTDGLVVCVAEVGKGRVGVDVENLKEVDLPDFRRVFTTEEYTYLMQLPDPKDEFHRLWTRKEAVMKADGRGFHLDPSEIDCLSERVSISGIDYQVRPLGITKGFAGHVAGRSLGAITIHHLGVHDLLSTPAR